MCRQLKDRPATSNTYLLRHAHTIHHNYTFYVRSYFILTQPYTTIRYKKYKRVVKCYMLWEL